VPLTPAVAVARGSATDRSYPTSSPPRRSRTSRYQAAADMPHDDGNGLTVVVATRNRQARLSGCLHELIELPEQPRGDRGGQRLGRRHRTASMVRERFPSVPLIHLPHNEGAVARNLGVRHASAPLVAFADDDSGWQPGSLAAAAEHLHQHPRLGLIAAQILVGQDKRVDKVARFMATGPIGWEADLPGPSVLGFLACAAVVRRDAFLQTGVVGDLSDPAHCREVIDRAVAEFGHIDVLVNNALIPSTMPPDQVESFGRNTPTGPAWSARRGGAALRAPRLGRGELHLRSPQRDHRWQARPVGRCHDARARLSARGAIGADGPACTDGCRLPGRHATPARLV
jgi:NAD(P)-dependent dehydrogenase (short-subunit alcohol dehydrogenase family)